MLLPTSFRSLLFAVLVAMPSLAAGQLVQHGNAFLELGGSARSESSARADLASTYYPGMERANPASLPTLSSRYWASGTFSTHFGGMANLGYASFALRIDSLSAGSVSLLRFGVPSIQNTLRWLDEKGNADYGRITHFNVADYALFLAYGRALPIDGLAIGGVAKVIYRHAGEFANGVGLGVDLGLRYAFGQWEAAAIARDITTTWTLWFLRPERLAIPENAEYPNYSPHESTEMSVPSLDISGAYTFLLGKEYSLGLQLAARATFDGPTNGIISLGAFSLAPALGIWGGYRDLIFVRLGTRQFQLVEEWRGRTTLTLSPSGGVGIQAFGFTLDYAFSAPLTGISMRFSHMVSLSIRLGERSGWPSRPKE